MVPTENGYYRILNTHSGQVLGIKDVSRTAGAVALQWDDNGTADHLWRIAASASPLPGRRAE
ncbi:RICIN domain-containing protein [Streptomyces sp. NPDC052101]|uniref:RICIN domain-containing protein n=1 Tax=Streptomyces sp. NPDC052101 TaxID=3155763 RepID=UPI00343C52FA